MSPATPPSAARPGVSFTQLFGIGANNLANQAAGFRGHPRGRQHARSASAWPRPASPPATVAGDTVVEGGDNSGAIALQNVITNTAEFSGRRAASAPRPRRCPIMPRPSIRMSPTQSNAVTTNQTTQDDRLQEAQSRMASNSGVNLDEELTNLTTYQQAYSAERAHADGGGPALSDPAADPVRT